VWKNDNHNVERLTGRVTHCPKCSAEQSLDAISTDGIADSPRDCQSQPGVWRRRWHGVHAKRTACRGAAMFENRLELSTPTYAILPG